MRNIVLGSPAGLTRFGRLGVGVALRRIFVDHEIRPFQLRIYVRKYGCIVVVITNLYLNQVKKKLLLTVKHTHTHTHTHIVH